MMKEDKTTGVGERVEKENPHGGHRDRLRERFALGGLDVLSDHEVLELLLMFAIPRSDVNPLAHRLLAQFGSLSAVLDADIQDLLEVKGIGERSAMLLKMTPELARRYMLDRLTPKPLLTTMEKAGEYAGALYIGCKSETAYLLCLDARCALKRAVKLGEGSFVSVAVDMQRLVGEALRIGTQNAILLHNHPAGSLLPSREDVELTQKVLNALSLVNITLLDHIIVSERGFYSFVKNGQFQRGAASGTVYAKEESI